MEKDLQDQLSKMRREAEERDAKRRAELGGHSYLSPQELAVDVDALALIPEHQARAGHCAVVEKKEHTIAVVAQDPGFSGTKEVLTLLEHNGYSTTLYVVSDSSLEYVMTFYKFVSHTKASVSGAVHVGSDTGEGKKVVAEMLNSLVKVKEALVRRNDPGKVSELLEVLLVGAIANRASDIHLEPGEGKVKVRYRIDGVLNDIFSEFEARTYRLILSRIKLLSNLKLNVKDEPQDGRFTIDLADKDIEVRVAIAPSEFGEVVVMRLLDPDAINLQLQDLGFRSDDLEIIKKELTEPHGMILNTGPTGSGKTTTLYGFLHYKHNSGIKIITIEDPIEYHLEGIEQTQVDKEAGYSFASGLRSLMRQDPDVILVGEIRDQETAEIAVQAALTGHLMFSTVHANEAAAGIPRLLDLGVKPVSLAPALNMLIAQRLVRRVCSTCGTVQALPEDMKARVTTYVQTLPDRVNKEQYLADMKLALVKDGGCETCAGTGYKGRVALFELLRVSPAIQELIVKGAGQLEIQKVMADSDFVSMQQDGVLKVISGMTTFEEVERVTGGIGWSTNG